MNYYNPYFSSIPYTPAFGSISNVSTSKGLFSGLFGGGKLSSFINGTQKTLNVINQAIPLVKQVSPIVKNAKTMFKVMNEFKRVDSPTTSQNAVTSFNNANTSDYNSTISQSIQESNDSTNNSPTFFL